MRENPGWERGVVGCSRCGRINRPDARFCAGCAAPVVASCRTCGRDLAHDARFCDQCGAPVDVRTSDDNVRIPEDRDRDDAVRKTVTVFFCDLSGSTSFEERVDAESTRGVIGRYHAMVQEVVEAGGGTVAKFQGDGAMALFGVPEVAVDDAERAVATGLEIQRRFAPFAADVLERYGAALGLRVGINTGEVVFSHGDADLVGDALNIAARLEAAGEPGHVLVGEDTWRLTRSTIAYDRVGVLDLKGKDRAVTAHRALDLLGIVDDSSTPFVGRDDEVARLRSVFGEAVAGRSVRLATVIGSPGVGKTRLAREFERAITYGSPGGATFVDLRCERAGATTFAPIADLLRSVAEIDDSMSDGEKITTIGRLVVDLDDADRVALLLASFIGAAPTRSTEELFFGVRRLIEALGRRAPLTLVVDDIQWAEPLFLDLLEHLAEWVHDAPVLLLGLARPELREIRPSLAEPGRRVAESLHLEGLDADATAELASQLLGGNELPRDLLARLPDSTEGNPLFVRELMRMLVDDDVIVETPNGWELTIDADAVDVPPTIQSLLSSRIERLPADERRLVELASVVGPDFPLGAVAAIGRPADTSSLMPTLERLRRKDLVESTGTYWGDEPLYRFHHVLIRDAAYRRLLKETRADLHVRVATWIERVGAHVAGEHEVTIGHHLEQAHDFRVQLDRHDDETVEIGRRAADVLGAAAHRALARDDVAAAGSLARRAIARIDADSGERSSLLLVGCEALLALGDVSAATSLLDELRDDRNPDARLTAWTRTFEAQLIMLTDPERLDRAEADAADAAGELASLDDRAGEANARLVRAGALARLGRIGECEAELDLALGAARAADDGRRVATVLGAAPVAALWGPSPVSRAGGRCLDVIRLLRITTGSPGVEATSTRCQAVLEALRGRFDTARTMLTEARATVEELGHRHGLLETELYSGIVELLAGDPVAAEPYLRSAYGGLGRLGIGADAGQAAAHLSRALLLQGRLDEAHELATDSDALAGQNPQTAIAAKTALAEIKAARGELDEALRIAEEAVARARGTDIVIDHANANLALARVRDAAGDAAGARSALDEAERLYREKGASPAAGSIRVTVLPATSPTDPAAGVAGGSFGVTDLAGSEPAASDEAHDTRTGWVDVRADAEDSDVSVTTASRRTRRAGTPDVLRRFMTQVWQHWGRALEGGDLSEMAAHIDADVEWFDRRELSWEALDLDGTLERIATVHELAATVEVASLPAHRVDGLLGVFEMTTVVRRPSGAEQAIRTVMICGLDPDSGLCRRLEQFEGDGLPGALARFDELRHGWNDTGLWNTTSLCFNRARSFVRTGGSVVGTLVAADATIENRGGAGTPEAIGDLDVPSAARRVGFGVEHRRLLAVRGNRLALFELRDAEVDGESFHRVAVVELDADSLIDRVTLYDIASLADAVRDLSTCWLEVDRPPHRDLLEVVISLQYAAATSDGEWFRTHVHDDCTFVDHRPSGFGRGDKAWMVDLGGSSDGTQAVPIGPDITAWNDRAGFGRIETWIDTGTGELVQSSMPALAVVQMTDHRVSAIELFAEENAEAARSRFDELSATSPAHEPWNAADAAWRSIEAGDRTIEGLVRRFAADAILDDRRRLHRGMLRGPDEIVSRLTAPPTGGDTSTSDVETIAARAQRLVLLGAFDRLVIARLDGEHLVDLAVQFDIDELDAAIAELDTLGNEIGEVDDAYTLATLNAAYWEADANWTFEHDFDYSPLIGYQDRRLRMVDHRLLGWPEVGFEGYLERLESFRAITERGQLSIPCTNFVRGLVSLFVMETRIWDGSGGEHVDRSHMINRLCPDTGVNIRIEQFAADDLGSARERFRIIAHEQAREDTLWNVASVVANRADSWVRSGHSIAGWLTADDVIIDDDVCQVVLPADHDLDDPAVAKRVGFGVEHRQLLAIRGNRLALFELRDGEPFHHIALVEIGSDCLICHVTLFPAHRLAYAVRQLERRWVEVDRPDHPDVIDVHADFVHAFSTFDLPTLERLLHPDFEFADHRSLGLGTGGKQWVIEAAELNQSVGSVPVDRRYHTINERGALGSMYPWQLPDGGPLAQAGVEAISTMVLTDGRISSVEFFAADELHATRVHFESSTTGTPNELGDQHQAWNAADRRLRDGLREFEHATGSWPARLAADAEYRDTRSMIDDGHRGPTAFESAFPPGSMRHVDVETVATRGDDLVLCRVPIATTDDDCLEAEVLMLSRWNADGEADLTALYDPNDLDAALAELDRLYVEQDPGPTMVAALRGWTEAYRFPGRRMTVDVGERILVQLDPELRMIDHRSFGWPEQGFEEFRDRIRSLATLDVELSFVIARIHRVQRPLTLVEQVTTATAPNGSVQTDRNVLLAENSPTSGLIARMEQWSAADFGAALVRFDERIAELAASTATDDAATMLCNRLHTLARAGSWEKCRTVIADEIEVADAVGMLARGAGALADVGDARRVGFGCALRRVLAVRGEQLALMDWTDDDLDDGRFRRFALVELNRRAEFERITLFDHTIESLITAADRLDDRWLELQPPSPVERVVHDVACAFRHRNRSELAPLLHADFQASDHRPIGWGSFNRSGWLDLFAAAVPSPVAMIVARMLDSSPDGFAVQLIQWALVGDELVEATSLSVAAVVHHGQIVRVEGYPLDDQTAAIDRLAELTGRPDDLGTGALGNDADRLVRAFMERLVARDVEGYIEDLSADVVLDDRRAVVHGVHRGRDAVMAFSAPGLFPPESELVADVETIAVRGDALALHRCVIRERGSHDGPTMDWLAVTRWLDGRLHHHMLHDPDALAVAVAALDEAHLEDLGDTWERDAALGLAHGTRKLTDGDVEGFLALHDPDLVMRDHRQLGWPELDLDGYRERVSSIFEMPGDLVYVMERRLRIDPTLSSCSLQRLVFNSPEGVVESSRSVMVAMLDPHTGRVVLTEQFDENDVEAAIGRYEELLAERGPLLWNRASMRSAMMGMWLRTGDTAAIADLIADDAVFIDENGAAFGPFVIDRRRVLAVRGEHLVLVELRGRGDESGSYHRFAVEETDSAHRLCRVTLYRADDLARATDAVERRWSQRRDGEHRDVTQHPGDCVTARRSLR